MKNFILLLIVICSLLFVNTPRLYSQNLNFFAQIIGTWESTYDDGIGTRNIETWNVQWILNKYFIQIDIHGDNPHGTYDEKYIFTTDENNQIIGWAFDAEPSIYFMNFTAKNIEDKISIDGKGKNTTYKFTLQLKDGKLLRQTAGLNKGEPVVYTKK
jgi:hypothetical protein